MTRYMRLDICRSCDKLFDIETDEGNKYHCLLRLDDKFYDEGSLVGAEVPERCKRKFEYMIIEQNGEIDG